MSMVTADAHAEARVNFCFFIFDLLFVVFMIIYLFLTNHLTIFFFDNRFSLSTTRYPRLQERVSYCEDYRADEKADDTKGDQAADNPGKDHNQGQIRPLFDKYRTDKVIEG
jgi:hypothetical protein